MCSFQGIIHKVLVLIAIISVIYFTGVESGETCRKKDLNGNEDTFNCPRLFESSKKKWCCGTTIHDKHCCEWSQKFRMESLPESAQTLLKDAVSTILIIILIIFGLIVGCCVCGCCLLSRKRQRRGQVLSTAREANTTITSVPSLPTSITNPVQYNAYQMQSVTPPYPMEQPPPYTFEQPQPPYNPAYPIK